MLLHLPGWGKQGCLGHDPGHSRDAYGLLVKPAPNRLLWAAGCVFFCASHAGNNAINPSMVTNRVLQPSIWYEVSCGGEITSCKKKSVHPWGRHYSSACPINSQWNLNSLLPARLKGIALKTERFLSDRCPACPLWLAGYCCFGVYFRDIPWKPLCNCPEFPVYKY